MLLDAPPTPRRQPAEGGFTLIEVLIGSVVIAIALMGHMASAFSEYKLARGEQARSEVLHVARQFIERMRSDDDWPGLYDRLRALQLLSDTASAAGEHLNDGRRAWPPHQYYPDFVLPEWMDSLVLVVDVPFDPAKVTDFREDLNQPRYGLPADLDGNGAIDAASRLGDYRALPVVLTFRWRPNGEAAHQMRFSTWLRGIR